MVIILAPIMKTYWSFWCNPSSQTIHKWFAKKSFESNN